MRHLARRLAPVAPALGVVCPLLLSGGANAESIEVAASFDASVMRWNPHGNHGADPGLEVKNAAAGKGGDFDRKAYLRFPLGDVDRTQVETARLELTVLAGAGLAVEGAQIFGVYGIREVGESSWGESTITWTNAPLNDVNSGDGLLAPAELLGSFTIDGTGIAGETVSLTSDALRDFVRTADAAATLVVVRTTEDPEWAGYYHVFASIESPEGAPPSLVLGLPADPECGPDLDGDGIGDDCAPPPPASCPPDLDESGAVDFPDLLALLSLWGPSSDGFGDLDGTGAVDFGDLLIVLGAWGPCP